MLGEKTATWQEKGISDRMRTVKKGLKYIAVFGITLAVLTGLLVCVALLPRSVIRENVRESAEYLCEGELFGTMLEEVEGSRIDRYADAILLAIAYQYDAAAPLASVLEAAYYYTPFQNENENLLDAVTEELAPNQQYLRYWHGSNVFVRPLLVFLNLQEIYVLNGLLLTALAILLFSLLLKGRAFLPAAGIALGMLLTAVWYVPLSLEYTWTWLLMLGFSAIAFRLAVRGRMEQLAVFFLVSGMLTNFVDFLTTETLTLLVPLLLVLWAERRRNPGKAFSTAFQSAAKALFFWGAGYAGMWVAKWLLTAAVLGENVLPYITGHISERLGGKIGVSAGRYLLGAIGNNLRCLFPFGYGCAGMFAGMGLLLFAVYTGYVYHRKHPAWDWILLYLLPGLVPYVRYLVLRNHSYLHCFFTYRAQLATVLAVVLALGELTERRCFARGAAGRGKP